MITFDCIVSADNKEIISLDVMLGSVRMIPDKWYSRAEIGILCRAKSNKWRLANHSDAEDVLTELNRRFNESAHI